MIRIFVYGTLMTGQPNHGLLEEATHLGTGHTEAAFDLINLGAFPALLAGGSTSVRGELYEVNSQTLAALDRLEGHPLFYRRGTIRLETGKKVAAYLFPKRPRSAAKIPSGDWRDVQGA